MADTSEISAYNDTTGYDVTPVLDDQTGYSSAETAPTSLSVRDLDVWQQVSDEEVFAESSEALLAARQPLPPSQDDGNKVVNPGASTSRNTAFISAARAAGITVLTRLGTGGTAHGTVFKCRRERDKAIFAIKWLLHQASVPNYAMRRLREMRAHKILPVTHPNLVAVEEMGSLGSDEYILMELCDETWEYYLKMDASLELDTEGFVGMLHQALCGLNQLHVHSLVHKDVQPGNVFLQHRSGEPVVVKLGDFGLSEPNQYGHYSSPLARFMIAPELWAHRQQGMIHLPNANYTVAADVWSTCATMALALLRAVTGQSVDWWMTDIGVKTFIECWTDAQPALGQKFGAPLVSLLLSGLAVDPEERATLAELLTLLEQHFGLPIPDMISQQVDPDRVMLDLAVKVTSERRRAGDLNAGLYLQLANVFAQGASAAARAGLSFESALLILRQVQQAVATAQTAGSWDGEQLATYQKARTTLEGTLDTMATAAPNEAQAASVFNTRSLLTLEIVKATLLQGDIELACTSALTIMGALSQQLQADLGHIQTEDSSEDERQRWRFLCFQHTRNYAIILVEVYPAALAQSEGMLAAGDVHVQDVLTKHLGQADSVLQDYNANLTGAQRWRDHWALYLEEARLSWRAQDFERCKRVCKTLRRMASDADDWMRVARAYFVQLQSELAPMNTTATNAASDTAAALVQQYVLYSGEVHKVAFGVKNAREHLSYVTRAEKLPRQVRNNASTTLRQLDLPAE